MSDEKAPLTGRGWLIILAGIIGMWLVIGSLAPQNMLGPAQIPEPNVSLPHQ